MAARVLNDDYAGRVTQTFDLPSPDIIGPTPANAFVAEFAPRSMNFSERPRREH
jgi:hypothetical protein